MAEFDKQRFCSVTHQQHYMRRNVQFRAGRGFAQDRASGLVLGPDCRSRLDTLVALPKYGDMTSTTPTGGRAGEPTIVARGLSKWFGSVVAVNDVSLQVYPGITGLLGPNGAGKTTLLHMISGLSRVSDGEVTVLGEPVRKTPGLSRSFGFMS